MNADRCNDRVHSANSVNDSGHGKLVQLRGVSGPRERGSRKRCSWCVLRAVLLVVSLALAAQAVSTHPAQAAPVEPVEPVALAVAAAGATVSAQTLRLGWCSALDGFVNVCEMHYCMVAIAVPLVNWFDPGRLPACVAAASLATRAILKSLSLLTSDESFEVYQVDPFRHCVWAAWLTIELDDGRARQFTLNHERGASNYNDEMMDHYNNAVGHRIGAEIKKQARSGISSGALLGTATTECRRRADLAPSEGGLRVNRPERRLRGDFPALRWA